MFFGPASRREPRANCECDARSRYSMLLLLRFVRLTVTLTALSTAFGHEQISNIEKVICNCNRVTCSESKSQACVRFYEENLRKSKCDFYLCIGNGLLSTTRYLCRSRYRGEACNFA